MPWPGRSGSPRSVRLAAPGPGRVVLGSSAVALVRIHPYELSYYNELIGGPRGAWETRLRADLLVRRVQRPGDRRPESTSSRPTPRSTSSTRRPRPRSRSSRSSRPWASCGGTSSWSADDGYRFPYVWLLTQDSKASAFTRLLVRDASLVRERAAPARRRRVASVADPVAVSRAWALFVLCSTPPIAASPTRPRPRPGSASTSPGSAASGATGCSRSSTDGRLRGSRSIDWP